MEVSVKYFGMVSELTQKKEDRFPFDQTIDTTEKLQQYLEGIYPEIKNIAFSIALNQKLISKIEALNDGDEIALLPPFAGG